MDDAAVSDEKDCTVNGSTFAAEDDVVAEAAEKDDDCEISATGRAGNSSPSLVVVVPTESDDNESHRIAAGTVKIIAKITNSPNVRIEFVGPSPR